MDGLTFNNNKLTVSKDYAKDEDIAKIVLSTYTTKVTLVSANSYNKPMKIDADNLDAELISVSSGKDNDTITSSSSSTTDTRSILKGGAGNDSLIGGTGNDTLTGDDGNDILIATGGSNLLNGGKGDDYIYAGVGGSDTVKAGAGNDIIFTGSVTTTDSLSYVDIYGEAGTDTFFINPGAQVILRDYAANELISLASGLSIVDTETTIVGSDVHLKLKNSANGNLTSAITIKGGKTKNINIDGTSSLMTNSWEQLITASYIKNGETKDNENLTNITVKNDVITYINGSKLKTDSPVTIKGGGNVATITSGAGEDSINVGESNPDVLVKVNGGSGNDILIGSSSNDTNASASLNGGAGDDILFAGEFTDTTMYGGKGKDWFVTNNETGDELKGSLTIADYTVNEDAIKTNLTKIVSYELSDNKKDVILHLNDSINGGTVTIKNRVGKKITISDGTSTVGQYFGSSSISLVNTDDSIFSGNDYFNSDITKISASGRSKAIEIYGNGNDNVIIGGKGDDIIYGKAGNNTLTGGAGSDTFVISAGSNDVIKDFTPGIDVIKIYGTIAETEKVGLDKKNKSLMFKYTPNGSSPTTYATLTLLKAAVGKKIDIIELKDDGTTQATLSKYYGAKPAQLYDSDNDFYDMNDYKVADLLKDAEAISAANRTNAITITGGNNTTSIVGGKGDDSLTGHNFTDENAVTLRGGAGKDVITGQTGHDALLGDAGDDIIYASSISSSALNAIATVNADITVASSKIKTYNILSGGAGKDTLVGSTTDDSMDGGAGDDSLVSNGGNDTLNGGAGNDILDGSADNDVLLGGTGNDIIYANAGNDSVNAGAGNDTIYAGTDNTTVTTGAGKDTIIYEGGNIIITDYTAGSDSIYLNGKTIKNYTYEYDSSTKKGDLILTTSDSKTIKVKNAATKLKLNEDGTDIDSITAATKVKLIYAGADSDTNISTVMTYGLQKLSIANADVTAEGTLDVSSFIEEKNGKFVINYVDASKRSAAYKINLIGDTSNSDELTLAGGAGIDTLTGGGGNNYLDGGKGNDILIGKGNANTLVGGKGNDILTGVSGKSDTFVYTTGDGNDTITNYESDHDILQLGSKATTINYVATSISGNDAILKIGSGTINLEGALDKVIKYAAYNSSDTTSFKVTSQFISIQGANSELDTIYAHTATNGTEVKVSNKDAIFIGTAGADNIVVNSSNSTDTYIVDSGAGNDTLQGGIGIDSLFGNAGNDTLIGGGGNDYINGGAGADIIYGDELDYTITSSGGNDEINGGAGNDTVYGGAGADIIYGDAGNDSIFGNAGNDTLDGGAGNDTLTGGDGNDVFIFTNGGGKDVITDYAAGDIVSLGNNFTAMITDSRDNNNNYVLKSGSNTLTFINAAEGLNITVKNGEKTYNFVVPAANNTSAYIAGSSDLFNTYVESEAVENIISTTDIDYSVGKLDSSTFNSSDDLTKITYAKDKD